MTYDNNKYEEIVISRLKYEFMDALSKVVNHCLSRNDRTLTVSDLTTKNSKLSMEDLLTILNNDIE
ncbi:hypothetical protein D8824_09650 [Streptococcus intermedius]|nr:hypothetical protein D8824_09650 [Streptococcus intermedius]